MTAIPDFHDGEIEPKPICGNCEKYDGGGLKKDGTPVSAEGYCLSPGSPRFTTTINQTCEQFWPCSTRWPNADCD